MTAICDVIQVQSIIKTSSNHTNGFHNSIKFAIRIAQIFGVFPVQGLSKANLKKLRFSWFSLGSIYSIVVLCSAFLSTCATIAYYASAGNLNIFEFNGTMFYVRTTMTCYLFLILGKNWPALMKEFSIIETIMRHYPFDYNLKIRLKIMAGVLLITAAVEHLLIQVRNILQAHSEVEKFSIAFEKFCVVLSYPHVFHFVPYHSVLGIIMQILNSQLTFGWTFLDVFIILSSTIFASKVEQIRNKISDLVAKNIQSEISWKYVHEDYSKLQQLFKTFNEKIHLMIILSFATNVNFILIQLFGTLSRTQRDILHFYYIASFGLIILRTIFVCLCGSRIYEECMKITNILVTVPSGLYNVEIKRFIVHLKLSPMVLNGNNFFPITRSMIIKIAGAIVSYELVLIQFSKPILDKMAPKNASCC